jgi:hypothetical protein
MSPLSPQDLDRIRFVTRHFHGLQGLRRSVPMGLIYLVLVPATLVSRGAFSAGAAMLLLGLLAAGASASWWMARWAKGYYSGQCGEVERQAMDPLSPWTRNAVAVLLVLLFVSVVVLTDGTPPSPHSQEAVTRIYCLAGGVLALRLWVLRGSRLCQAHYLVFGLLSLGLAAPVHALDALVLLLSGRMGFLLAVGCFLVVTGLLDHRVLVRTLRQLAPEPHAQAGVAPAEARR